MPSIYVPNYIDYGGLITVAAPFVALPYASLVKKIPRSRRAK